MDLTERRKNILSGAIGMLLVFSLIVVGIKFSFGAYDDKYQLSGTFAAAGQGLLSGSDVKIRGVNVGEVRRIELVDNRAKITLDMKPGVQIPADASAVIRPKTLFGEKFIDIDPGANEVSGPFLDDEGVIQNTLGGFELEQVLTDAYPVLQAIDPAELAVIIDELSDAGAGLGPNINNTLGNLVILTDLQVSNDAELRQFLGDLALLTEEFDRLSPTLLTGARNLNAALPSLNARGDKLRVALEQLARVSTDLADLLENNQSFIKTNIELGGQSLQLLFDNRSQIQPLLTSLVQYARTTAEAIRIPVGDGTLMAAVKSLTGGPACENGAPCDTSQASAGAVGAPRLGVDDLVDELRDLGVPEYTPADGADALMTFFGAVLPQ